MKDQRRPGSDSPRGGSSSYRGNFRGSDSSSPRAGGGDRREGGFRPRPEGGGDRREGGFRPRPEGGGDRREGGFRPRPEGGGDRREGGFRPRPEGGGDRREGGFRGRPDSNERKFVPRERAENAEPRTRKPGVERPMDAIVAPEYDERKLAQLAKNHTPKEGLVVKETVRLNKLIANAGIASRRDADALIANGQIYVNNEVVTEMGYQVGAEDVVTYNGKILKREKQRYILLNKPKDYITTAEDPNGRKTVLELVQHACKERVYPVGRLDRNTTGLLLITNDGELADKLSHPSNEITKIYQVDLDRPFERVDFDRLEAGITLEDGAVKIDGLEYVNPERTSLGIEIHSGKNRIVRRLFEFLGYTVEKLDRVVYAGLTKKDLPRGHYRFLTEQELINLKYFS